MPTYQRHVDWMHGLVSALDLQGVTLVGQDWGGFIGIIHSNCCARLRVNPRVQADVQQGLPGAFAALRKTWLGVVGLEAAIRHDETTRRLSEGNRDKDQADPGCQFSQVDPPTEALAVHPIAHAAVHVLTA